MSPSLLRLITSLFFMSGAIGLVYEVVWGKMLGAVLGHTGLAHAVVLATFMGGLAIGNALLGRLADRAKSQLYLYGWLELGVGVFAALSPMLLHVLSEAYVKVALASGLSGGTLMGAKMVVAALALLPPTILMGGTLPALGRFTTQSLSTMQSSIARLYFLNSFGAVAGSLIAGFVWIPAFGHDRTLFLGAGLNVLIGIVSIALSKRIVEAGPVAEAADASDAPVYGPGQVRVILIAVAVSGFVSLAYEVVWIRLLSLVLGSSTYSFSLMLAAFVGGIATGSWLIHRGAGAGRDPFVQFGWAQWGIALSIMATLPFYENLPMWMMQLGALVPRSDSTFYLYEGVKFVLCFLLMLAPATCIGMTLPLASRVATRAVGEVGTRVGTVFSLNTMGNVAGALLGGLVLMPMLGLRGAIEVGLAVNLALAGLMTITRTGNSPARRWAMAGLPVVIFGLYHTLVPGWDTRVLGAGVFRHNVVQHLSQAKDWRASLMGREVLYHKDDASTTVDVYRVGQQVFLMTNGKPDAGSEGDLATMRMVAHLPLMLRPKSEDVLVIGQGSGISAGATLKHPIKNLDIVEISKGVIEGSQFFNHVSGDPLSDPRTKVHVEDASGYLRLASRQYDMVLSEPSNPWVAGIGNLFTVEFYQQVSQHLKPGGMMVQWFHLYEMDDPTFRLVVRTFASHFPYVTMWQMQNNDVAMIGSHEPLQLDGRAMAERFKVAGVKQELSAMGVDRITTLLSLQVASDSGVRRLAGGGPVNHEHQPILEYQAPKAFFLNSLSYLPFQHDERQVSPAAGSELILPAYLAAGARTLTGDEFENIVGYQQRWFKFPHMLGARELFLRTWREDWPQDRRAEWGLIQVLRERGQHELALARVEALLAKHPKEAAYLDAAVDLEFQLLPAHTGYLGGDETAYARMKGRLATLKTLQPAAADGLDRRLAAIAFATGHLQDGYASIDRSAALADAAERPDLWMVAADAAFKGQDYPATANYLKRVLTVAPDHPQARALAEAFSQATAK